EVVDIAAFPDGSVVVVAAAEDYWGATFYQYEIDWVIARIARDGTTQWMVELGSGVDSTYDFPERIAIDPEGNVVVGGMMYDDLPGCGPMTFACSRSFIAKLNGLTGET